MAKKIVKFVALILAIILTIPYSELSVIAASMQFEANEEAECYNDDLEVLNEENLEDDDNGTTTDGDVVKYQLDLTDTNIDYVLDPQDGFKRYEAGQILERSGDSWFDVYMKDDYAQNYKEIKCIEENGSISVLPEQYDPSCPEKGYHYFFIMPYANTKICGISDEGMYQLDISDSLIDHIILNNSNRNIPGGQTFGMKAGEMITVCTRAGIVGENYILQYKTDTGSVKKILPQTSNINGTNSYFFVMPNYSVELEIYEIRNADMEYSILYESDYFSDDVFLPESYRQGDSFEIPDLVRPGYIFRGWFCDKNGKQIKIKKLNKTWTGNVVLTAKWEAIKYSVKFNKNGNGVKGSAFCIKDIYFDDEIKVNDDIYMREGYIFKGWALNKNGMVKYSNTFYLDDELVKNGKKTITLYAIWERDFTNQKTYNITYENELMLSYADEQYYALPKQYVQGEKTKIPSIEAPGYKFAGWYNKETGKKVSAIKASDEGDITLVAKWKKLNVNIAFNKSAKAAKGKMKSQKMMCGERYELPQNGFVYPGYKFLGWSLQKDGTTVDYADKAHIYGLVNGEYVKKITLYAVWKKNASEIKLSDTELSLAMGEEYSLCLQDDSGDILNSAAVWSTSDEEIVDVDEEGNLVASDTESGTAVITAKFEGFECTCKVSVLGEENAVIMFEQLAYSTAVGNDISTVVKDSEGNNVSGCTFRTSDSDIATIDNTGKIHAVASGECYVFAQKDGNSAKSTVMIFDAIETPELTYRGHFQNDGWMSYVTDGQVIGKTGKGLRLEAFELKLLDSSGNSGISSSAYVEGKGWLSYKNSGETSGTVGECRQLNAIKIKLTNGIAQTYNVYYRVYVSGIGWLGWAKDDEVAGSEDGNSKIEGIQIKLVRKSDDFDSESAYPASISKPKLTAAAHIANYSWISPVGEGATIGTTGQGLRLEAVKLTLNGWNGNSAISYRAHVANKGWLSWVNSGQVAGTTGQSIQSEAYQIKLSNEYAALYDIYYRAHVANYGWLGWAKNGEIAGTVGNGLRAEALQIKIVKKGSPFDRGGTAYIGYSSTSAITLSPHMGGMSMKQGDYSAFYVGSANWGCCAVSYAVGLSILNGTAYDPTQFWRNKTTYYDLGRVGAYVSFDANTVYNNLKAGKPTMVHYMYSSGGEHWVLINGIRAGANTTNLQYSDFYAIDPQSGDQRPLNSCYKWGYSVSMKNMY